jgi:hypothetical protein
MSKLQVTSRLISCEPRSTKSIGRGLQTLLKSQTSKILKDKYYTVSHQASSKYIKNFTSFVMDKKISPSDNWVKIHLFRKEAHRHSGSTHFDESFMWNTFIDGLRPEEAYVTITEGFSSNLDEMSKLQRLDEKWQKINKTTQRDKAFQATVEERTNPIPDFEAFAYGGRRGFRQEKSRSSDSIRSDSCFKCSSAPPNTGVLLANLQKLDSRPPREPESGRKEKRVTKIIRSINHQDHTLGTTRQCHLPGGDTSQTRIPRPSNLLTGDPVAGITHLEETSDSERNRPS